MKHKLDLSRKVCHVCHSRLEKDFNRELEWCNNTRCILCHVKFNIPYKTPTKLTASVKAAVR